MGLDMYLEKRTYIGTLNKEIAIKGKEIKQERVSRITEDVGYWRKANAIHRWFVENVQHGEDDCKEYEVSREQLKELLEICKTISKDHLKAPNLLPTMPGFFFGEIEYDEYYFENIEETKELLKKLLKEKDGDFYYSSSW